MNSKTKLTFYGGASEVGGVNFLLEVDNKKILIDAGFHTGCTSCLKENQKSFFYKPSEIDIIILTQSHLEHSGQIPHLVREGFKGVIYSTPESRFMSELVYRDYLTNSEEPDHFFDVEDIKKSLLLWKDVSYKKDIFITDNLSFCFSDAKHILGSALVNFKHYDKNLLFANSLGSSFPEDFIGAPGYQPVNYLVAESVYGNKIHKIGENRKDVLENIIENTISRKGTVFLPISSVDKTFTLLRDISDLIENGRVPKTKVYIDSSLVEKAIGLYSKLFDCFDGKNICEGFEDFTKNFNYFVFLSKGELKKIEENDSSKIVIYESSTKFLELKKYLSQYIKNPNNSIVFVDYQITESIGRKIQEGLNFLKIENKKIPILAQIETIEGYSEHADHNKLFMFVDSLKEQLDKAFIVVGEPRSSMYFAQKLKDYMGINAILPKKGKAYSLDF